MINLTEENVVSKMFMDQRCCTLIIFWQRKINNLGCFNHLNKGPRGKYFLKDICAWLSISSSSSTA